MSVFDMDGMKPALDGMVPAPVAEVGIENEINRPRGTKEDQEVVTNIAL
jgi:hypothetical protein